MDGNRAEDGVYLRYRFGYERKHNDTVIANLIDNSDCSVFEMLAALAIRCEEHIMNNPDIGNRTGKWFWCMINNLGLSDMNDENFDEAYTEMVIDRFLDHEYKRNGEGGLFVLECPPRDLRYVEIWHQAMWFLDEYLENREE